MKRITPVSVALALLVGGCKKEVPLPLYERVAVATRDITVAAEAAGSIEPILVVDVKSRASGTILSMRAETGDLVRVGDTLVLVDRRDPTNTLNQAQADLEVARAQLSNAESQKRRMDQMFTQQLVSEQEHEAANLTYANARAQLVRAETQVQTARDALDDTSVRAPISGVIIAKNVEVGNVIASATRDVSGGVVLLKMADLNEVQVRTLVDETDIGKIQPGVVARITVDAYPNRPFQGTVLKIEPQSTTNQNVTMFPVLIRIANLQGLLRPGMNAQVEIQVAGKQGVLAIPNAALRTQRDVASAASVLGLLPADVQRTLAQADSSAAGRPETAGSMAGRTAPGGQATRRPDGQQSGQKGRMGAPQGGAAAPGGSTQRQRFGTGNNFQFGGSYIVFVLRDGQPAPVRIRTGVTDMDYSEVVSGLTDRDTVLLLPSASLVQSQQEMRDRFNRMTGGGVPGMKQQAPAAASPQATTGVPPAGGGAQRPRN